MKKSRVDELLVSRGFFLSTDEARRAIMAGLISTSDRRITSGAEKFTDDVYLHVKGQKSFVSRGGIKLEGAFKAFNLEVEGYKALDIGCSTGGFTDCLLQHGCGEVVSVDVGYAQFDWQLRNDTRVSLFERTNIVDFANIYTGSKFDIAVSDVSFTSLKTIISAPETLLREGGIFITLVKPQFEASRDQVDEGGIVRDPSVRFECLKSSLITACEHGFITKGMMVSPIHGAKGNVEYLLYLMKSDNAVSQHIDDEVLKAVVYREETLLID